MISVNQGAESLLLEVKQKADYLDVKVETLKNGATIFDFSKVNLEGAINLAKICMGNVCRINLAPAKAHIVAQSGPIELEMLEVETMEPIISCMASQYAGWNVKVKIIDANGEEKTKYKCMGSGPARALAITEKELFEKLKYKDEYNAAVLVLEASKRPDEDVADYIAKKCKVAVNRVYLAYAPTACLAGSVQIAGRIVETSIHKFLELGMPPEWIKYGTGVCPIAPVADDDFKAMGWTNDCIIFAGNVTLKVEVPESDEGKLRDLIKKCPSTASKSYGKPFAKIFKEAGGDFYKIDPGVFAPARITVINIITNNIFTEGDLNPTALDFS